MRHHSDFDLALGRWQDEFVYVRGEVSNCTFCTEDICRQLLSYVTIGREH